MSTEVKKFDAKRLHMLVVLAIIVIFHFLPPVGEMTTAGMQVFGIFVAGIYGWIFVDLLLPSIVCLLAIATTDAITMNQYFLNGLGSQTFVMIFGILFLTVYITQTNLANVIVGYLMSRKIALGRPYVCLFLFLMACYLVSMVSNALVTVVMFLALYRPLAKQIHIQPYDKMNVVYFAGLGLAACMGEVCMPFKPFVLIVLGMMNGFNVSIASLTMFLFPTTVFIVGMYVLFCKFILRIDASANAMTDLGEFAAKATKKQILALVFIGVLLLALLVPSFMPADFFLNRLGNGGIVLAILTIMMLIYIDGEPLLDIRAAGREFNWDIFFNCVYFMPMGSLLVSDVTGIKATISAVFGPLLSGLSPYVLLVAVVAIVVILTNFLNNGPVAMIFIAFIIVLTDSLVGVNALALIMVVVVCAFFSLATPAANAAIAFLFTQKDLIHAKDFMLHAVITCVFVSILMVTVLYWYANIIF